MSYRLSKIKNGFFSFAFCLSVLLAFSNVATREFFLNLFEIQRGSFESSCFIFLVIFVLVSILRFPLIIWSDFYLEQKFGGFELDFFEFLFQEFKNFLMSLIFAAILSFVLVWTIFEFKEAWWFVFGFYLAILNLILIWLSSVFHKSRPLENEILKQKVRMMFGEDFEISVVQKAKVDARILGLWQRKRILISAGLLQKLEENEIISVLSHEFGHLKRNHNLKKFILENFLLFVILFLSDFVLKDFLEFEILLEQSLVYLILLSFGFFLFASVVENFISRKFELEADLLAVKFSGKNSLKSALLKIEETEALPKLIEFLFLSHPTLERRLKAIEDFD